MTKHIELSDRAYRLLASQKRRGESISDVVIRLAAGKKNPWRFVGKSHSSLHMRERLELAQDLKGPALPLKKGPRDQR